MKSVNMEAVRLVYKLVEDFEQKISGIAGIGIKVVLKPSFEPINNSNIQAYDRAHYDFPCPLIQNKSRERKLTDARHVYCYLMRKHTTLSLKVIGNTINRDHTTVINSMEACKNLLDAKDPVVLNAITEIERILLAEKFIKNEAQQTLQAQV